MFRLLLGLFAPLVKLLGVSALTDAVDMLRAQFDRIEERQKGIEERLAKVEGRVEIAVHGIEGMVEARRVGRHAAAADPSLPGEGSATRARRLFPEAAAAVDRKRRAERHVAPDPDPTPDEDEEPPESLV